MIVRAGEPTIEIHSKVRPRCTVTRNYRRIVADKGALRQTERKGHNSPRGRARGQPSLSPLSRGARSRERGGGGASFDPVRDQEPNQIYRGEKERISTRVNPFDHGIDNTAIMAAVVRLFFLPPLLPLCRN